MKKLTEAECVEMGSDVMDIAKKIKEKERNIAFWTKRFTRTNRDEDYEQSVLAFAASANYLEAIADMREVIRNLNEEDFAILFHRKYEHAAVNYGWKTQKECQTDFWELPKSNRKTMTATIIQIKLWLLAKLPKEKK